MQKEIVALIESMTKKRDELNAAIGALSRVRVVEPVRRAVAAPPAPVKRNRSPSKRWTPEHRAKFLASMAARRAAKAKANGAIPGEGATSIPEPSII